jgi:hypothetical protein
MFLGRKEVAQFGAPFIRGKSYNFDKKWVGLHFGRSPPPQMVVWSPWWQIMMYVCMYVCMNVCMYELPTTSSIFVVLSFGCSLAKCCLRMFGEIITNEIFRDVWRTFYEDYCTYKHMYVTA